MSRRREFEKSRNRPKKFPKIGSPRFFPGGKSGDFSQVLGLIHLNNWVLQHLQPSEEPLTMVEVGSHGGESALIFSSFPQWGRISCVDIWPWSQPKLAFEDRLKSEIESGRVFPFQVDSVAAATDINFDRICPESPPNFVYVDADHTYERVKADLESWFPRLADNGFLGGHDYSRAWPGVMQAVEEFAAYNKLNFITFEDSSFVFYP